MSGGDGETIGPRIRINRAAAGAQGAALQELWLSAEIPVEPCSRLQHLQRPTPSHLGSDTPDATRRGDENMARGRRSDVRIPVANGSTTLASPQRDNTTTKDTDTRKRAAAARRHWPSSTKPTTRSRRSSE